MNKKNIIDFSDDYIEYKKKQMNDLKGNIDIILEKNKIFKNEMLDYFSKFEKYFSILLDEVDSCILWLNSSANLKNYGENTKSYDIFDEKICKQFEECNNFINSIKENDHISKIKELNHNIVKSIQNTFKDGFNPQSIEIENVTENNISTSGSDPNNYNNLNKDSNDYDEAFSYIKKNVEENCSLFKNIGKRKKFRFEL